MDWKGWGLGASRKEIWWVVGSLNGFNSDFKGLDQIDASEESPCSSGLTVSCRDCDPQTGIMVAGKGQGHQGEDGSKCFSIR